MSTFTQQYIVEVDPPLWSGTELSLSWTTTAPAGYASQVYLDGQLAWANVQSRCDVPWPHEPSWFDVGSVPIASAHISFADELPAKPRVHTQLSWSGGTYLDPSGRRDVKGFRVYGEAQPGGGILYSNPLADIPAYTGRILTDGWNLGGYGLGTYGFAPGSYQWRSGVLTSGTWAWAVRTYDAAGNEGAPALTSDTIVSPPAPPAPYPGTMIRLTYQVVGYGVVGWNLGGYGLSGPGQAQVVLMWNPSPG